jgi:hypothetical protein
MTMCASQITGSLHGRKRDERLQIFVMRCGLVSHNLLTITPWSRALLEKLTVTQLFRNSLPPLIKPRTFIIVFTRDH